MKHLSTYFMPLLVLVFVGFFSLACAQTQGPGYETQRYIVTQIDSQTVPASQPWHNPIGERVNDVKVTIQDITNNRIISTRQETIRVVPGEDFTDTLFYPRESGEGSLIFRANMAGVLRPAQVTSSATYDSFSRMNAITFSGQNIEVSRSKMSYDAKNRLYSYVSLSHFPYSYIFFLNRIYMINYDSLGRVSQVIYDTGTLGTRQRWVSRFLLYNMIYDSLGNLVRFDKRYLGTFWFYEQIQ